MSRLSIAEDVADRIATAIFGGDFEKDNRLGTKDDIQQRYGIARGTVNEVIRLLSSRQLISARPGPSGGIFAMKPTPLVNFGNLVLKLQAQSTSLAKECLQLKDILDPWVAADASQHRTAKDLKKLEKILPELEQYEDLHRRVATNWLLHRTIAECCKNSVLKIFYLTIMDLLETQLDTVDRRSSVVDKAYGRKRYELHCNLVQAIKDRNAGLAWQLGGERHQFFRDGPSEG